VHFEEVNRHVLSGEYFFLADTRFEHTKIPYSIFSAVSSFGGFVSIAVAVVRIIGKIFAVKFAIGRIIYLLHKKNEETRVNSDKSQKKLAIHPGSIIAPTKLKTNVEPPNLYEGGGLTNPNASNLHWKALMGNKAFQEKINDTPRLSLFRTGGFQYEDTVDHYKEEAQLIKGDL